METTATMETTGKTKKHDGDDGDVHAVKSLHCSNRLLAIMPESKMTAGLGDSRTK